MPKAKERRQVEHIKRSERKRHPSYSAKRLDYIARGATYGRKRKRR